jgi:hypothetical protein
MAELLIKAIDATHSDPVKDKAGCYKRGDIVVIMPDGHEWGKEERLPKFMVVKIPGMSVAEARKYIEGEINDTNPDNIITITRRKHSFLVDDTPSNIKDELNTKGEITVTWDEIKGFVQDKLTKT